MTKFSLPLVKYSTFETKLSNAKAFSALFDVTSSTIICTVLQYENEFATSTVVGLAVPLPPE